MVPRGEPARHVISNSPADVPNEAQDRPADHCDPHFNVGMAVFGRRFAQAYRGKASPLQVAGTSLRMTQSSCLHSMIFKPLIPHHITFL